MHPGDRQNPKYLQIRVVVKHPWQTKANLFICWRGLSWQSRPKHNSWRILIHHLLPDLYWWGLKSILKRQLQKLLKTVLELSFQIHQWFNAHIEGFWGNPWEKQNLFCQIWHLGSGCRLSIRVVWLGLDLSQKARFESQWVLQNLWFS